MGLTNLQEGVTSALDTVKDGVSANPYTVAAAAGGVGVLGGAIVGAVVASKVSRKKRKSRTKSKRSKKRNSTRRKRTRRTPRTAGKGKDRSTKRIRYTKKGQPYVITRSGKAKFIKKSSAKQSRKRKGGRY